MDLPESERTALNSDPVRGEGWLIKISFTELPALLSFDEYSALIAQ